MKKAPKTRFLPYQEGWASKRFADVFSVLPNNTLSRADLSNEAGSVKNVHYGDVLIKFGEYLDAAKIDIPFIASDELAEKWKSAALQDGDVVMADTAEDTTAGKCTEIGNVRDDIIVSGLHTIPLHPLYKFSEGYLGYYMNSDAFHDQLIPLMQGTKVTSISKSYLADTELRFPADPAEQESIAKALYSLDEIITAQKCKCEKLVALKAAYLDKMFPKQGSKVPELRFAGFTGDWEQRKVGTFASVLSASRVHKDEWRTEGVPFYRSSDVVSAFKGNDNDRAFISTELYKELIKSSGKLEKNDILITGGGSIGIPYIVPNNEPLYSKDADLIWIKKSAEHDSQYLFAYFTSQGFREYIRSISHVGTIAHYTIEQVKDTPVLLPSIDEQSTIGGFFSQIDTLVTLHQSKLKKLRQFKQAMMHNMFV